MKMNYAHIASFSEIGNEGDIKQRRHHKAPLKSPLNKRKEKGRKEKWQNHHSTPFFKKHKKKSPCDRQPSQLTYLKVNSQSEPVKIFLFMTPTEENFLVRKMNFLKLQKGVVTI